MARPKGALQKNRNESKYWLPEGIKLKEGQADIYNKETKLIFIDPEFGEFTSYFKAIQDANASTHPESVKKRRNETNMKVYGGISPMSHIDVKNKQKQVILDKYGVSNISQHQDVKDKKKQTLMGNYGVDNPMKSEEIRQTYQINLGIKHGVINPMHSEAIKQTFKDNFKEKYGVENPSHHPPFVEKILQAVTREGSIFSSKGEDEIRSFIQSLGLNGDTGYIGGARPKQIDIKIREKNIGIEYNGCFWHCEGNKKMNKNYHRDKTRAAKEQGLRLIQIFDYEWDTRQPQVKSFLKSALGKNERLVYGRKTEIVELEKKEASNFLETYHILGSCNFFKAFGLKLNNELLCLITIGKHHRKNNEWVLSRFVGKENVNVIGGLSRLTSHAVKEFGELTTWIDLRFSDGSNWLKSGWILELELAPDYFYYDKQKHKVISKQSRKKKLVNTPEWMTEREHAKIDKLSRIYDCGKLKLRFKK